MKYYLLLGGFMGFTLVFCASFYAGNHPPVALRDASFGCVIGALLFRLLHAAIISGFRDRVMEKNKQTNSFVSSEETSSGDV